MSKRGKAIRKNFAIHSTERRGISFQLPPNWTDGSGKVRHVEKGLFKGRVMFTSQHEARELAKRFEDKEQARCRYNPD